MLLTEFQRNRIAETRKDLRLGSSMIRKNQARVRQGLEASIEIVRWHDVDCRESSYRESSFAIAQLLLLRRNPGAHAFEECLCGN